MEGLEEGMFPWTLMMNLAGDLVQMGMELTGMIEIKMCLVIGMRNAL